MNDSRTASGRPRPSRRDERVSRALRRSLIVILAAASLGGGVAIWLNWPERPVDASQTQVVLPQIRETPRQQPPQVLFVDVTAEAGITFVHQNGATGQRLLPETMGSGCALFDYDSDGDADLLLVNSTFWPGDPRAASEPRPTPALYRNEGNWRFTDVTREAALNVPVFGMGVAVGDYDNDGDDDIFMSAVGTNRLLRNDRGRFVDVTEMARVGGEPQQWSSSCTWLDYDNDGRLDLFVGNYIAWSPESDLAQDFTLDGASRAYGPPFAFQGAVPYLYHNEADGTFTEVAEKLHLHVLNPATGVPMAKSLGVAAVDLDQDGWLDIVVANDTVQNFLFHNQQGQGFAEIGAVSGTAFDSQGQARGAMGIDAAAFRNDRTQGLVVGNFANEMTALYMSLDDPLLFLDAAVPTGLGPATRLELTFGVFFWDYDLDGRLDLLESNGHIEPDIAKVQQSQHYAQPPRLFWNAGPGQPAEFVAVEESRCGPDLCAPLVGRGSAFADLDGDGDLDVLLTANGGPPRLVRNDQHLGHHWLRLDLAGTRCNRSAIGARVEIHCDGQVLPRVVMPPHGYLSQSERALTVGLGTTGLVDRVVVHWPGGGQQEVLSPTLDQTLVIEQAE